MVPREAGAAKTRHGANDCVTRPVRIAELQFTVDHEITDRLTKRTSVRKHRKRRFFLEFARHLTSSGGWLNKTAKSIEPKP